MYIAPKERRFHGVKFPIVGCRSKVLKLEPNSTILFRQCIPHQGMSYSKPNLRVFCYLNCKSLRKPLKDTSTVRISIDPTQRISIKMLLDANAHVPNDTFNIKTKNKTYQKRLK